MGDIINLRQARKARARADQQRLADSNRAKFGRTKAEKQAQSIEEERQIRKIEGVRREDKDKATD
jgi:phage-related minor tail protein